MNRETKFIGLINQKGGVAKSTIASSLAMYYTHALGMDVNLMDLDATNLTQYLTFYEGGKFRREAEDLDGKLVITNTFLLRTNHVNICDFPCNVGINEYVGIIDKHCGIAIFPTTYDSRDLDLLVTNTLPAFSTLPNKVVMFVKTKNNDLQKTLPHIVSEDKLVLRTGLKNAPKFYDDYISDSNMSLDYITNRLDRLKDFKLLVKFINKKLIFGE